MTDIYNLVQRLTSDDSVDPSAVLLRDFSRSLGWHPSDQLDIPQVRSFSKAHLVVENGLENAAVLSFLRGKRLSSLSFGDRAQLLNLSYNVLVDWHVVIASDEVAFLNNRASPLQEPQKHEISPSTTDALRVERFMKIASQRTPAHILPLEQAFLNTITHWKQSLTQELGPEASNSAISSLFNDIILVRAMEDYLRDQQSPLLAERLIDRIYEMGNMALPDLLADQARRLSESAAAELRSPEYVQAFRRLDLSSARDLIRDFYRIRSTDNYEYDFSLISKSALSRLYERYVSKLRVSEGPQTTLFGPELSEVTEKGFGSVYTPPYIARFFARFIREQMAFRQYQQLRVADPACGSGIFVRSFLEMMCNPTSDSTNSESIRTAFQNTYALDVEPTASNATRVSLTTLAITLTGQPITPLNVHTGDALEVLPGDLRGQLDVVVTNPPFVAPKDQPPGLQKRLAEYLSEDAEGPVDFHLAFIKMALLLLKDGGYGCFVLPHSFLLLKSAQRIRARLGRTCTILFVADLSAIDVFENFGVYAVLVIFKLSPPSPSSPTAIVVQCRDFPGRALQAVVDDRLVSTDSYQIFRLPQSTFTQRPWILQDEGEFKLESRLRQRHIELSSLFDIREGMNTGADDIFILGSKPDYDGGVLFQKCVRDRQIAKYGSSNSKTEFVFYPYVGSEKLTDDKLATEFPETFAYLREHHKKLAGRSQVLKGNFPWWQPERPRPPKAMMVPKIITPHLVISPRFAVDETGDLAVSRAPILLPYVEGDSDLLLFALGVLNSVTSFWFLSQHSHKYSRGYAMLEPKTLRDMPFPDPSQIDFVERRQFIDLVRQRLNANEKAAADLEAKLNAMVAGFYGLSSDERQLVGLE